MKELFGIPIIEDDRLDPSKGFVFNLKRTCECVPANLACFVLWPEPGVQCRCGAVWTLAYEPEVSK